MTEQPKAYIVALQPGGCGHPLAPRPVKTGIRGIPEMVLAFALSTLTLWGLGQQPMEDFAAPGRILTPQVHPEGQPLGYPIIEWNSGTPLLFQFDQPGNERETYWYTLVHCDHRWIPSDLEKSEYIRGFEQLEITDVEASFGTRFDYVHYSFQIPNDMMMPTVSGNYCAMVFSGADTDLEENLVAVFRFVLTESRTGVQATLRQSSVISRRFQDMEVDCRISTERYPIVDPYNELYLTLLLNGDWNHAIHDLKPVFVRPQEIVFDYNSGENAFPGGSEWRDFDTRELRFNGRNVIGMESNEEGYQIYLQPDLPAGGRAIDSRIDANGKFVVQSAIATEHELEAEYVRVHFELRMPEAPETRIHIEGALSAFSPAPWIMAYDRARNCYRYSAWMKQGYYNYRYVMYDMYHPGGDVSFTEGNHAGAENDVHVLVYQYDRALGADRVIAVSALNSVR